LLDNHVHEMTGCAAFNRTILLTSNTDLTTTGDITIYYRLIKTYFDWFKISVL